MFLKNELEKIGVFKEPNHIPRLFDTIYKQKLQRKQGNDIDNKWIDIQIADWWSYNIRYGVNQIN